MKTLNTETFGADFFFFFLMGRAGLNLGILNLGLGSIRMNEFGFN